ncbi:MAG: 3-dehydroquinate synthase [Gammaproteobacteria bacterium]|nr:3-dehydroquinate synthase [Gammaproteobacteria bacterium]
MKVHTLEIEIAGNSKRYPVLIGQNLLDQPKVWEPYIKGREVVVITHALLKSFYGSLLGQGLAAYSVHWIVIPEGEHHKTLGTIQNIIDTLLQKAFDRTVTLIAFGGGVIGDMVGFTASCYLRGVGYIQVPTTLLAQVDAALGGKTGVDHPLGKNMIGAFYHPESVLADITTLATLPDRHYRAGFSEVVKYGLIRDRSFFEWCGEHTEALLKKEPTSLIEAVKRSCQHKIQIVRSDERERGARVLLNLGHTFAHAIEAETQYKEWLHGEAVSIGLVMAARYSNGLGYLGEKEVSDIRNLLKNMGLPIDLPRNLTLQRLGDFMVRDKKAVDGQVRFILLKAIGEAFVLKQSLGAFLDKIQMG